MALFFWRNVMSIKDQVIADQQAVQEAQSVLDAANAKLVEDQSSLNSIAPHLCVLDELEVEVQKLSDDVKSVFLGLIEKARSLF